MFRTVIASGIACVAALALAAGAFAANPHENPPVTIDCGADGSFQVMAVPGNGNFTPVHVIDGGTLIPVAFSNQVATVYDSEGNIIDQEDVPDVSHPAPANKDLMSCSFTVSFPTPEGSMSFSGDVVAFLVPAKS